MLSHKPGYILITTLFLLTGLSIIIVSLLRITRTAQEFSGYASDRVYAQALAHSGIEIATSQLVYPYEHNQQDNTQSDNVQQQQEQQLSQDQRYLLEVLRYINRWQTFELTKERDGVDGTIYLYICPEQGKFPLHAIFDRNNKQLTQEAQNIIPQLNERLKAHGFQGELTPALSEIAQDPTYVDDPTQLIPMHSAFTFFDDRRFVQMDPRQDNPIVWKIPALMDLLTVHTDTDDSVSLHPLFFSRSVCDLLGLQPLPQDREARDQMVASMQESMPSNISWKQHWDTLLAPYYNVQLRDVPESLVRILSQEHGATRFSVVSYAHIDGASVYLYAILERVAGDQYDTFRVHRMYWI